MTTRIAALSALALTAVAGAAMPNGVASGDTTATSSILWGRSTNLGQVTFEYSTDPSFNTIAGTSFANVSDVNQPVKAAVNGLTPGTRYYYRATDSMGVSASGQFKTNFDSGFNGFRFGVSGDWRGELAPYPGAKNAVSRNLDLWVGLGDTVYADFPSPAVPAPQATTLDEYRRKHSEVYESRFGQHARGHPLEHVRAGDH